MLIATIYALYLLFAGGGGSFELFIDLEERAADVIVDEARRARIVQLSRDFEAVLDATRAEFTTGLDELSDMHRDFGAEPADFDAHAARVEAILDRRQRTFLETRAALKKEMSREEWEAVVLQG